MSLLGIIRHLAEVERGTFRKLMAGQDAPRRYVENDDRDWDFNGAIADDRVVADAWEAWRREAAFTTEFIAAAPSLDITAHDAQAEHGIDAEAVSLREIVVGLIEEYARHLGHVDLLRERIDGRLGQ